MAKRGVGFRSLTEAIDTTTPGGQLIFHIFGALGHYAEPTIMWRYAVHRIPRNSNVT